VSEVNLLTLSEINVFNSSHLDICVRKLNVAATETFVAT